MRLIGSAERVGILNCGSFPFTAGLGVSFVFEFISQMGESSVEVTTICTHLAKWPMSMSLSM
jgi:hypothetical protein